MPITTRRTALLLPFIGGAARAAGAVLAPSGTLRAAYIVANLAQATRDPATGAITGVVADITAELGRRAGVATVLTPVETAAGVLRAVSEERADVGFVAPNPERTGVVLYSRTYMLVQQSALVRKGGPIRSVRELDRPGQVIGANADDSVGTWLRAHLHEATVRSSPDYTLREAAAWLLDGTVQAFAGNRQRLRAGTAGVAGLALLSDNLYPVPQTIAVPLDRPDRLFAIDAILDALRTSGFLAEAMRRSGVDGIEVAPPS